MMKCVEKSFSIEKLATICCGKEVHRGNRQVKFVESDSRKNCHNAFFFAFVGEKFDAHDFLDSILEMEPSAICISRPLTTEQLRRVNELNCSVIEVDDTVKAYQSAATYLLLQHQPKVIAITGSTGKTSIKTIVSGLLENLFPGQVLATAANTNNHIGVPQNIFRLEPRHHFCILEMGTSSPGEIEVLASTAPADIAILCNVGASHIGNFSGEEALLQEKAAIFSNLKEGGKALTTKETLERLATNNLLPLAEVITCGEEGSVDFKLDYRGSSIDGNEFSVSCRHKYFHCRSRMSGRHQALNCTIALATVSALGLDFEAAVGYLPNIILPGMRMKQEKIGQRLFINDAYNANPQSMQAALRWLAEIFPASGEHPCVILGDMLELGDMSEEMHNQLRSLIKPHFRLFCIGEQMTKALGSLAERCFANATQASAELVFELPLEASVFLKASRGMALEKIIENCREKN